jgi:hypothetical protein
MVEPMTPITTVSHGFNWNFTRRITRRIQAGGAKTGMVSTARAAKKTSR